MSKKILLALGVLVLGFVVVVAMQPATYTVTRSIGVATPPDVPFGLVNDFHRWNAFSPWDKLDPNQKTTFSGAMAGVGAIYEWDGNDDVGAGRMTITGSKPNARVDVKLEFTRPFPSQSEVAFLFEPTGTETTRVTWQMTGHNGFLGKMFCLFVDMDAMLGKDFEAGLAALKTASEAELKKQLEEKVAAEELERRKDAAEAEASAMAGENATAAQEAGAREGAAPAEATAGVPK